MRLINKYLIVIFVAFTCFFLSLVDAKSTTLMKKGILAPIYYLLSEDPFDITDLKVFVLDMKTYLDQIHSLKIDKENSVADSYQMPTEDDLSDFYSASRLLFNGELLNARLAFNKMGYELAYLEAQDQVLISLQETTIDQSGRFERGWGGALIPATSVFGKPLVSTANSLPTLSLQAPHTFHDSNSGEVARQMFMEFLANVQLVDSHNVVYIFNTAYRNNSTIKSIVNANYRASDFARDPRTAGRMLNKALVDHTHDKGRSVIHVSIHGYSLDKRPEAIQNLQPTPNDVILGPDSVGLDLQDRYYQNLVNALPGSYLCGDNWPENGGLCGNTDEMYRDLLVDDEDAQIFDSALHIEIETERRKDQNYVSFTTKLTDSLIATLLEGD